MVDNIVNAHVKKVTHSSGSCFGKKFTHDLLLSNIFKNTKVCLYQVVPFVHFGKLWLEIPEDVW